MGQRYTFGHHCSIDILKDLGKTIEIEKKRLSRVELPSCSAYTVQVGDKELTRGIREGVRKGKNQECVAIRSQERRVF